MYTIKNRLSKVHLCWIFSMIVFRIDTGGYIILCINFKQKTAIFYENIYQKSWYCHLVFGVRLEVLQEEEVGVAVDEGGGAGNAWRRRAVVKLGVSIGTIEILVLVHLLEP
jgi:hypothetical protein